MNSRRAGGRPFAAGSGLLLATALVLAGASLARIPLPAWPRGDPGAAEPAPTTAQLPRLSALEPGNGPAVAAPANVTPAAPGTMPAASDGPAAAPGVEAVVDDPATVPALEALAAELGRREAAVAEREHRLKLREAVIASVEERVGREVARMEALAAELQRLTGAVAAEEQARITQLVKVYEAMKAKNAAAIFEPMALDLLLPIVRGMRETKVAAIVAEMDPAKARALTAELARRGDTPTAP